MLKPTQHKNLRSNFIQSQPTPIVEPPKLDEAPAELPFFEDSVLFAYKSRRYIECIKTIERILKVTPKEHSSHYKILLAAANTMTGKNFKRSHNLLNSVLYLNPFDAYALYGKGVAFYFEGKFDESIEFFDRAINVDDGMEQAKEMKIKAQVESKQVRVVLQKIKVNRRDTTDDEKIDINGKFEESSMNCGSDMDLDTSIGDRNGSGLMNCGQNEDSEVKKKLDSREGAELDHSKVRATDVGSTDRKVSKLGPEELDFGLDKIETSNEDNFGVRSAKNGSEDSKTDQNRSRTTEIVPEELEDSKTSQLGVRSADFEVRQTKHDSKDSKTHQNQPRTTEIVSKELEDSKTSQLGVRSADFGVRQTKHDSKDSKTHQNRPRTTKIVAEELEDSKTSQLEVRSAEDVDFEVRSSGNVDFEVRSAESDQDDSKTSKNGSRNIEIPHTEGKSPRKLRSDKKTSKKSKITYKSMKRPQLTSKSQEIATKINPQSNLITETTQTPQNSDLQPQFSSESFKNFQEISTNNLDSSSEDSTSLQPTTSANSIAQQHFNKALDLYMLGQLQRSIKYFQKSLELEPDFEEADEMETKAKEFIELLEIVEINMAEKNYAAIVEICSDGLDIDEGNDAVNRRLYFQRGLAYFHLGDNEKSMVDYKEYERLGKKLEKIGSGKLD